MNEFITTHYLKNKTRFMRRLYGATKEDAKSEDILHEAYERALRYWPKLEGQDFEKWFSMVLQNALRDYMREEKGRSYEELDEFDHQGADCEGWMNKVYEEVEALIDSKPSAHAEILRMHYKFGFSPMDISRITEYSYDKSHKVIYRFREQLRKRYS